MKTTNVSVNKKENYSISYKYEWQSQAHKQLDLIFTKEELEEVLSDEFKRLLRSDVRNSETAGNLKKSDYIKTILNIYETDLLTNKNIGPKIRSRLDRYLGEKNSMRFNAGSVLAQEYVLRCGLPIELAGRPGVERRDPYIILTGRAEIGPLADFQDDIHRQILDILEAQSDDRRGLISLPTGAGKTRTMVEAIHTWIHRCIQYQSNSNQSNLIIWVAQKDELCEQAFQEFEQLWKVSAQSHNLKIVRMWGGFWQKSVDFIKNSISHPDMPIVLVTTNITLHSLLIKTMAKKTSNPFIRKYQQLGSHILNSTDLIVIDEAHHSGAKTYKDIIEEFKNTHFSSNALKKKPKFMNALLGITATPFRSTNEVTESTKELKNIFSKLVLPVHTLIKNNLEYNANALKVLLQRRGILAREEHEIIETKNTKFSIEVKQISNYDRDVNSAIDTSHYRHQRRILVADKIISIVQEDKNASILYFGATQDDARYVSFYLNVKGCQSASLDHHTDIRHREKLISDFKNKKIDILCNCQILTTGFDAPKITHIVIGWQTTSPVLLNQMIGRGLRGTLFGGTDKCTIYQVRDTIKGCNPPLAMDEYLKLWQGDDIHDISDVISVKKIA